MCKFDIAKSPITDNYYFVIGKDKYDITDFVEKKYQQGRADARIEVINEIIHTYLDGVKDTFNAMQDSCRNGHQVQNPNNHKKWQQCCFPIENGKFDMEKWKCCYENCPLMKNNIKYLEN